jgi:hypothetical protein
VSPCVPATPDPLMVPESSGIVTCPVAPGTPPARRGLRSRHVSRGSRLSPAQEGSHVTTCLRPHDHRPIGLRYCHMSSGSRPASRCGRALEPPHTLWPSASDTCSCVPKAFDIRLIMPSLGTWSRWHIKCVQDKSYTAYG